MRHVWLRSIAVIGIGLAMLAVVLVVATTIDARAPRVLGYRITQPAGEDDQLALTTTSIEVTFSEPVVQQSAEDALRVEPDVSGSFSWTGSTLVFTPAEPLPLETSFTVTVASGVVDPAGNEMRADADPFTFQTSGRPEVVASAPEDASDGVDLDAPIQVSFSALMDTSSVEEALTIQPSMAYELRWAGRDLEIVPDRPLRPGQRYVIVIGPGARDVAGVAIGGRWRLSFRTVASTLDPAALVPTDGIDGVAGTSPIAALFDEAVDPESLRPDQFRIEPEVSGSVGLEELPAWSEGEPRYAVRFTPSGPLPPNTTFSVELLAGVRTPDGAELAEPVEWSFTTGAPIAALSNQLLFLSDRSGISNLWTMNPDGTSQRQLSAELVPIVDFAVAPDARSVVLADGRRLILQTANGSARRVLTGAETIEFDPAWSPDGRTIVFGRADAATRAGLGLWTRSAEGGDERRLDLPAVLEPPSQAEATPSDGVEAEPAALLRAPRYAPDGQALAFAHPGWIGILELPEERLTQVPFHAAAPPVWLPDASGVLVSGVDLAAEAPRGGLDERIVPLDDEVQAGGSAPRTVLVRRSGRSIEETRLGDGAHAPIVDEDGSVSFLRWTDASPPGGRLFRSDGVDRFGRSVPGTAEMRVASMSAAPEEGALVLALLDASGEGEDGIWLLDLGSGRATQLTSDGRRPRWSP